MVLNYLHLIFAFLLSSTRILISAPLHEGYTSILQAFRVPSFLPYFIPLPPFSFYFFFFWPQQKLSGLKERVVRSTLSLHIRDKIHQPDCFKNSPKHTKAVEEKCNPAHCSHSPLLGSLKIFFFIIIYLVKAHLHKKEKKNKASSHGLSSVFTHFLLRWTPADPQSWTSAGILPYEWAKRELK